jgi:hypothetical protein
MPVLAQEGNEGRIEKPKSARPERILSSQASVVALLSLHRCQKTSDLQGQLDLYPLEGGLMCFLC